MKTIELEEAARLVKEATSLTAEERAALRAERLKALVGYAKEHSPYLSALYKDLGEDFTLEDLPVTQKADLLAHYHDWVTDPELDADKVRAYLKRDPSDASLLLGKYTALQTSGSTGNPLPMVRDDYHNKIHACLLRQRLFMGVEPGLFDHTKHKTAFLVHISNSASSYGSYLKMKKAHPGFDENIIALSIMDDIDRITAQLNAFQPEIIVGYPPVLVMLAQEKKRGTLQIPVKLILSSAELLTDENYYRIREAFGVPILNNYCMTEGGEIAMTNQGPALHINDDWIIVEPVDENLQVITDPDTYSAGILVTDLSNYVQPIIRYFVSDTVRISPSEDAGNDRPVLHINGRVWESFTLGGKAFTSKALEVKAKFQQGLCQYQFVQTDEATLELRGLVAAGEEKKAVLASLADALMHYFEEAGCKDAKVVCSMEPLLHNANGGKTPVYIKTYKTM